MLKNWNNPKITNLSIANTESSLDQYDNHDLTWYDAYVHVGNTDVPIHIRGHQS